MPTLTNTNKNTYKNTLTNTSKVIRLFQQWVNTQDTIVFNQDTVTYDLIAHAIGNDAGVITTYIQHMYDKGTTTYNELLHVKQLLINYYGINWNKYQDMACNSIINTIRVLGEYPEACTIELSKKFGHRVVY
jgi:hypothetical protein